MHQSLELKPDYWFSALTTSGSFLPQSLGNVLFAVLRRRYMYTSGYTGQCLPQNRAPTLRWFPAPEFGECTFWCFFIFLVCGPLSLCAKGQDGEVRVMLCYSTDTSRVSLSGAENPSDCSVCLPEHAAIPLYYFRGFETDRLPSLQHAEAIFQHHSHRLGEFVLFYS